MTSLEAAFARDGFAIAPSVLAVRDVAMLRRLAGGVIARYRRGDPAVLADAVDLGRMRRKPPSDDPAAPDDPWTGEPYIIGNLAAHDPGFASLLGRPALWRVAARLLACEFTETVFHFSNLTRKPPMIGPGINWHRDGGNRYFAAEDGRTLRLLVPLQPMSAHNGGTAVVPGSHRSESTATHAATCPVVDAGSGLALHSNVLHGGAGNRSALDRDVLVVQFGHHRSRLRDRADELLSLSTHADFTAFVSKHRAAPGDCSSCHQGGAKRRVDR